MQSVLSSIKRYLTSPIIQLTIIVFASLLIYIFAFLLPINLLELYDQPRLDRDLLFYQGTPSYVRLSLAFIGVWVLYWLGYRISFKASTERSVALSGEAVSKGRSVQGRSAWIIVIFGMFAFITVFLFVAPFDAADIYDNIMHGRILGVHDANPFQQVIADYPDDPFHDYAAWKKARSAYGPLWESLAGLTAWLAGDGIIANVLAFKLLPGLFHLAGVAFVVLYLRRDAPEQALSGALLLGWNPMMLYETWGNGHNDVAMAFWFLLAAWWIKRRHYTLAALSLLAGALMKFLPIILIPAVLLIAWRSLETLGARFIFLAKTGTLALIVTAAAYYPFWNGLASFSVERRMSMFTTSIPAVIYRLLKPILGLDESARLVSLVALGLLAVFVLFQSFRMKEKDPSRDFAQITFNILGFYLMITCLWFQQWYSLWLICLAPLLSSQSRNLALVFSFWVVSKQLVFGPEYVPTMFWHPETSIRLEPLLTSTVLGIPWLYALWILFRGKTFPNTKDTKVTKRITS
ncbi:MAG: hypothetical protein L0287_08540 [Anaerolineae bacterium]|nr:hypothetical protein [Anaerolineae bacterium]MCI0610164.1 hypothetical protein [Anaerolineae bacterium]